MDNPISLIRMSPSPILGVLGGSFHFYSNSNRTFCEQTVVTLIRRRVLRRLIWVCAVCLSWSHKKDAMLIWVKLSSGNHNKFHVKHHQGRGNAV